MCGRFVTLKSVAENCVDSGAYQNNFWYFSLPLTATHCPIVDQPPLESGLTFDPPEGTSLLLMSSMFQFNVRLRLIFMFG